MTPSRHISRLRLSHFRNYPAAALDLDHRHVVLTGPNGAGKTNLIEAVSLLSPGRGLRRASFDTLTEVNSDAPWAVATTIETPDGPVDIGTGLTIGEPARFQEKLTDFSGSKTRPDNGLELRKAPSRRVRINGANARAIEDMTEYARLLWLTPDMDGLFRGPPGDRRRFLDRLVMTLIPGHGLAVSNFEKTMRQRNKLLEQNGDAGWLSAIEAQMAQDAAAIHFARQDSLGHLQQLVTAGVDPNAFPAANLALGALFEDAHEPVSSSALEAELIARWAQLRHLDRAVGRTTLGPHRVDLEVTHAQKNMPAALCSTGEQKALLIGLVLAHARLVAQMTGIVPILLLDEVAAHLDPGRRIALFDVLEALGGQCWMTGTDHMLFEALGARAQYIEVSAGQLAPAG